MSVFDDGKFTTSDVYSRHHQPPTMVKVDESNTNHILEKHEEMPKKTITTINRVKKSKPKAKPTPAVA